MSTSKTKYQRHLPTKEKINTLVDAAPVESCITPNLERVCFEASFPPIQSAIVISGSRDGLTLKLAVPESQMASAIRLQAWRDLMLLVTLAVADCPQHCTTFVARFARNGAFQVSGHGDGQQIKLHVGEAHLASALCCQLWRGQNLSITVSQYHEQDTQQKSFEQESSEPNNQTTQRQSFESQAFQRLRFDLDPLDPFGRHAPERGK